MSTGSLRSWTIVVLLAWGVLALGASRPWGYLPLLAGMALFGGVGLLSAGDHGYVSRGLRLSLTSVAFAVFLQLVPLPTEWLRAISPAMESAPAARPLSIDPNATALGLLFVATLGLFFVGAVRTMGRRGARRLTIRLAWLGVIVALAGIVESTTSWHGIYETVERALPPDSMPHGPFSSRNHYAAWMLMTLALTMGYLCAILEQPYRATAPKMLFIQCASMAMAVALVQTKSRAGILGLALAIVTMGGVLMFRGARTRQRRVLAMTPLVLLVVVAIAVTGAQPVGDRFTVDSWSTAHGRLPIWKQATDIARDFAATGSGFNTYQKVVGFYPSNDLDAPYEGAHNDFLQLAAEGGLLVGVPVLVTIVFFIWEMRLRIREAPGDGVTEWLRIGAVVGLALVALQETVDFSLQIPGNAALFAVLAAIAVHRAPLEPVEARLQPGRRDELDAE